MCGSKQAFQATSKADGVSETRATNSPEASASGVDTSSCTGPVQCPECGSATSCDAPTCCHDYCCSSFDECCSTDEWKTWSTVALDHEGMVTCGSWLKECLNFSLRLRKLAALRWIRKAWSRTKSTSAGMFSFCTTFTCRSTSTSVCFKHPRLEDFPSYC